MWFVTADRLTGATIQVCDGAKCDVCATVGPSTKGWAEYSCVGTGDSVKISLPNNYLQLCEVQVFGKSGCEPVTTVAPTTTTTTTVAPTTITEGELPPCDGDVVEEPETVEILSSRTSSVWNGFATDDKIYDGLTLDRHNDKSCYHSGRTDKNAWVQLYFRETNINGIKILNRRDCCCECIMAIYADGDDGSLGMILNK